MLMTPHHQIEEVVQKLLRNVVGGSMLTPAEEQKVVFFSFYLNDANIMQQVKKKLLFVSVRGNILGFLEWLLFRWFSCQQHTQRSTHLFW